MATERSQNRVEGSTGGSRPRKQSHTVRDLAGAATESIDELSLEQALKDVDIANARVMDLTQRLISAQQRTIGLEATVNGLQVELHELRARDDQMRNSRAFRTADRYWRVVGALRQ
jgi:hypothetical protein